MRWFMAGANHLFFFFKKIQMAHMHEIGGKTGAARGTSTPTISAKVRNCP